MLLTSSLASSRVMRPRRTASSTTSWSRSRDRVTLRSSASRNASTLLSLRSVVAEGRVELFRWLAPVLFVLDLEPLDLEPLDLEPLDLVAIQSPPTSDLSPRLTGRADYLMPPLVAWVNRFGR